MKIDWLKFCNILIDNDEVRLLFFSVERLFSEILWIWDVLNETTSRTSLLTGKGLQVYTSMPPDQANNYDVLKKALLKRYQLTEEGFRAKPERGETVVQLMARLTN